MVIRLGNYSGKNFEFSRKSVLRKSIGKYLTMRSDYDMKHICNFFYLLKQCAALSIHCCEINTPPHVTVVIPFFVSATCHGQSPNLFVLRVLSSEAGFSARTELPHPSNSKILQEVLNKYIAVTSIAVA